MKQLLPIRNNTIKRYFDKFKFQRNKRTEILAAVEESETLLKDLFGEEYRHFTEEIPEIKEFMIEVEKKEKLFAEEKAQAEIEDKQAKKESIFTMKSKGKEFKRAKAQQ